MAAFKSEKQHTVVRKRKVFYIPGYDPYGPRRYRELYRLEAQKQCEISGHKIDMTGRKDNSHGYGWDIQAKIDGVETHSSFDFLLWSDVVQDSQSRTIFATFLLLFKTAWVYLSTGALQSLSKTRKTPIFAALYPVFFLTLQFNLALLAGWSIYVISGLMLPWVLSVGVGGLLFWITLKIFRKIDKSIFAYYLMHDYGFSASKMGANPPELELKITLFAKAVLDALEQDWDEILVVGHSSGAHIGISVMADVIRAAPRDILNSGPKLSLLTLGQVVPMVSFLPKADRLRADLHSLSKRKCLTWIDVSAPTDPCCFALVDPVAVSGVAPNDGPQLWPLVMSAAYTRTIKPERMEELKTEFFKLHLLYLCALDYPEQYDYFAVTAGPMTLNERFEGYNSSPKTNRRPMSEYRGMTANPWRNR